MTDMVPDVHLNDLWSERLIHTLTATSFEYAVSPRRGIQWIISPKDSSVEISLSLCLYLSLCLFLCLSFCLSVCLFLVWITSPCDRTRQTAESRTPADAELSTGARVGRPWIGRSYIAADQS